MRTIFFGSPPFALGVFAALASSKHRPTALVTTPQRPSGRGQKLQPSKLAQLAQEHAIEVLALEDPHAPDALARLRSLEPDLLLVASYGRILKRELLFLAPQGAWNVHASLLPRWRGASPIQAAILEGDSHTGVCVQRMVAALDAGDVICSARRAIGPMESAGELLQSLSELGGKLLLEALDRWHENTLTFSPQDPALVTIARKLDKTAGHVRFDRPAEELARAVRAYNPWPLVRCADPKGKELAILCARALAQELQALPGQLRFEQGRLLVATQGSSLELVRVQPAGKQPMTGAEYARGARLTAADSLRPL